MRICQTAFLLIASGNYKWRSVRNETFIFLIITYITISRCQLSVAVGFIISSITYRNMNFFILQANLFIKQIESKGVSCGLVNYALLI